MTQQPEPILTNICGILVHVHPERQQASAARLLAIPGLEIHAASETGKLVVTLEADTYKEAADALQQLQTLDGVLSAALIYHHAEECERTQSESQS